MIKVNIAKRSASKTRHTRSMMFHGVGDVTIGGAEEPGINLTVFPHSNYEKDD